MVKRLLAGILCMISMGVAAQEMLSPLQCLPQSRHLSWKNQPSAVRLPLFDDFSAPTLCDTLWLLPSSATITLDVSPLSPTVGVATLDAIAANGKLHPHASTNRFPSDTLCSLPIRLDGYSPADSLVLSFYYLPGGGIGKPWERVGEAPDTEDSLLLEFYRPSDSSWQAVWSAGGTTADSLFAHTGTYWQYTAIAITDPAYCDSTFMFRFRNLASLDPSPKAGRAGNGDHWHIDYVQLDANRSVAASHTHHDVAFAAPAPMLLNHYRAVPYRQYDDSLLRDSLHLSITNLFSSQLATHYTYRLLDTNGTVMHTYDGGFENAPTHLPGLVYQTAARHANPPVDFTLGPQSAPVTYTIEHIVQEGNTGDDYRNNDTVRLVLPLGHSFAYDDGTPENGYGLTSTASNLYLAYRFDLLSDDTLTAVDFFFNATLDDANANIPFYITIWRAAGGRPAAKLYRDHSRRRVDGGRWSHYVLEQPLVCSAGESLFVGFEQSGNSYINLGFDRSNNTADRIWYLTGTEWQQSILAGSLMIRPCFGAAAALSITPSDAPSVAIYPNPAFSEIHIVANTAPISLWLYDSQGRQVYSGAGTTIDVRRLPAGLYLLRIAHPEGNISSHRIIINRHTP